MSLDVFLNLEGTNVLHVGIPIREDGQMKRISRAEWDERYPDREPIAPAPTVDTRVYSANITHNLNRMASEAGIYQCLWRPGEIGIERAKQLIEPLTEGLALLESDPERFEAFNPSNGWGTYERLVSFVREYLMACMCYPDATVSVWR